MFSRAISALYGLLILGFVPFPLRMMCFLALGVLAGLGLAIGKVSRVTSYLSDDPEGCVNCHVMQPHYASWQRSSHANVATCNDCHVPHETFFHAYAFKARDGIYHSTIFTLGLEPQVIEISSGAIPVVENNCRRCHEQTIEDVDVHGFDVDGVRCWDCHREVPHGRVRSLSSAPRVMGPELPSVLEPQKPHIGGRFPRPNEEPSHE
ncbi:MAG: cytochrome c nitrite reductase small subunit [Pirellulales bacterium]|nr:cytochrome c nitrite reductase small subunit [Pirellulales bacterium]